MRDEHDATAAPALDFDGAERAVREGLLRLRYLAAKLQGSGASALPAVARDLQEIERRTEELTELWLSLRRERLLTKVEELLAVSAESLEPLVERLHRQLDEQISERALRRELGR